MGQSPSHPTLLESFEGKDLFDMTDDELYVLLVMHPWKKDEVLELAQSLKNSDQYTTGFYSKEDDSPETHLAVRLNDLSRELARLRFSVVPSRLKEPLFWECIFQILRKRLDEHNSNFKLSEIETEGRKTPTSQINGYRHQPTSPTKASSSFPDDESDSWLVLVEDLKRQLAAKDDQILDLQRQLEALQGQSRPVGHKGEWVMDKDSQDFLSYPEEVKENMRKEKQKRLRQVQLDMKFILDSDKIEDSNGHWACCGEKTYQSRCPKSKSKR